MNILFIDVNSIWVNNRELKYSEIRKTMRKGYQTVSSIPIGLMSLSSSLKKEFGNDISIKLVNTVVDCRSPEMLQEILKEYNPDIVGLRSLSMQKNILKETSKIIKEFNNNIKIIVGGPYPTCEPRDALNDKNVDMVCIGEGEETIVDLVRYHSNSSLDTVLGIGFKQNGDMIFTPQRNPISDLDKISFPDYSLIDFDSYKTSKNMCHKQNLKYASLVTSRGCPYKCLYCHQIFGKKFRARSPKSVFSEIIYLHKEYGINEFQIIDDTFNLNEERAHKILDLIIQEGLDIKLAFPNGVRGDILSKELIDKLIEAGTRFLYFAVETASKRLQKLIEKNLNLDKIFDNINYASSKDCVTGGFFMLGFPSESEEEANETIEFAKTTNLTEGYFFIVRYYPWTKLYKLALQQGLDPIKYSSGTSYFDTKSGDGVYKYSLETMHQLILKANREFYFSNKRVSNAFKKLPVFFSAKEIKDLFVNQIFLSKIDIDDIEDEACRKQLEPYFESVEILKRVGIEITL
jgi:radical SAM superfamily enzyme YgiQ (UPF0313 family)